VIRGPATAAGAPDGHPTLGAIPHTLSRHLCIDFVNSRFTDHAGTGAVHDRLEMEDWRRWFVTRCGLVIRQPAAEGVVLELASLRQATRRLLESRQQPDPETVLELDRWLSGPSLSWGLVTGDRGLDLRLRWRQDSWAALAATVVRSYAELVVSGAIERVRVCANPDCSFMFCDETRNRSRRWCEVAVCGNLLKVREHRARARAIVRPGTR
jgi:predicted RNA-binding Zn ribbon-like protein